MDSLLSLLLFFAGIALLWSGTEAVLRRVPRLASALRVSPLLVTALLLAVMTSLPEFCVSLLASLRGQPSAAVSNIVGSNFVTLTFVAGLCALWRVSGEEKYLDRVPKKVCRQNKRKAVPVWERDVRPEEPGLAEPFCSDPTLFV